MKQVTASINSNSEVMPGVYLIWLESSQIASTAQPGQFVMVRCGGESVLPRPLSIHQLADKKGKLALLYFVVGKGTYWLSQRKTGDGIDLFGPLGNGFSIHPASHNLLLVAGGIGIAPLCFLAQQSLNQGHSVTLLLGTSTATQLYPKHFLPPKTEVITISEDGTDGQQGIVTNLIPKYVDRADQIFACGPAGMYKAMAQMPELRDKLVQISLEVRMGCGRRVCYGCTVKTKSGLKQVCTDGPVFDLEDILWDELDFLTGV